MKSTHGGDEKAIPTQLMFGDDDPEQGSSFDAHIRAAAP
jgi:hypothetical protein